MCRRAPPLAIPTPYPLRGFWAFLKNTDAYSVLHEPPYAEQHVRRCEKPRKKLNSAILLNYYLRKYLSDRLNPDQIYDQTFPVEFTYLIVLIQKHQTFKITEKYSFMPILWIRSNAHGSCQEGKCHAICDGSVGSKRRLMEGKVFRFENAVKSKSWYISELSSNSPL